MLAKIDRKIANNLVFVAAEGEEEKERTIQDFFQNPDLEGKKKVRLDFSSCNLTEHTDKLIELIKKSHNITYIDLSSSRINFKLENSLFEAIQQNEGIDKAYLNRGITKEDLTYGMKLGTGTQDDLLIPFIKELITRAKNSKFLYNTNEQDLSTFKEAVSTAILNVYNGEHDIAKKGKFVSFLGVFKGKNPKFTKKENEFLDKVAKELKSNFEEINHKNPLMKLAQNIWILFASIFFSRKEGNDQGNGYTKLVKKDPESTFADKIRDNISKGSISKD